MKVIQLQNNALIIIKQTVNKSFITVIPQNITQVYDCITLECDASEIENKIEYIIEINSSEIKTSTFLD